jgi:MYXO-CTERM domain-containing protein
LVLDASARVLLSPIEVASGGVHSLRVARPGEGSGAFYHFEYRQKLGEFDSGLEDSLTDGVLVRATDAPTGGGRGGNPHLLDMTPDTSNIRDATLTLGMTFQDDTFSATVVEVTPDYAVLDVTVDGTPPDPDDPVGIGGTTGVGGTTGAGGTTTGSGGTATGGAAGSAGAAGTATTGVGGAGTAGSGVAGTGVAGTGVAGSVGVAGSAGSVATTGVGGAGVTTSAVGDQGGCACRAATGRSGGGGVLFALSLVGLCGLRRRRD